MVASVKAKLFYGFILIDDITASAHKLNLKRNAELVNDLFNGDPERVLDILGADAEETFGVTNVPFGYEHTGFGIAVKSSINEVGWTFKRVEMRKPARGAIKRVFNHLVKLGLYVELGWHTVLSRS